MASKQDTSRFKELVEIYGLTKDDFFRAPQGFIIVTRTGVEKIQYDLGARVGFAPVPEFTDVSKGLFVVKAFADLDTDNGVLHIESFGECSPKNNRNAYPIAMAEKRALSRVVLKMAGFYELGVYGEDEMNQD